MSETHEEDIRFYPLQEEREDVWEEYYSALRNLPDRLKEPVPFVVQALPIFKDYGVKEVLDLGCGMGRHSIYLTKMGYVVVGVDTSISALRMAKAWSRMERIRDMIVLRATMNHLPFVSQCFHAAISISVLHHSTKRDIVRAVEEIYRLLNDNGLFLANILSTDDYRYGLGQEVEKDTFRISEDFEERWFEEIHHFSTKGEVLDLLRKFRKININLLQNGKKEQLRCYWKVIAIK